MELYNRHIIADHHFLRSQSTSSLLNKSSGGTMSVAIGTVSVAVPSADNGATSATPTIVGS